jgi:nucleotide-binding universal stress UspA family protein
MGSAGEGMLMFTFMLAGGGGQSVNQTRRLVIIVGVDASAEAKAAAEWAVGEAELRKTDVLLVHAYKVPLIAASARAAIVARGRHERQDLLNKVAASLVVLGQDHPALDGHMPLGHTASTVASMSRHPVVAVPRSWTTQHDDRRPIAVAIDGRHPSHSTLGYAFTEASLRQAPVLVLHSAPLADLPDREQATRLNLAEILASWKADYPDVDVDTLLLAGPPRDTVAPASADTQLLVVGVPYRGREWTRWIRSVARAVLNQASCPVAVIPQHHAGLAMPD